MDGHADPCRINDKVQLELYRKIILGRNINKCTEIKKKNDWNYRRISQNFFNHRKLPSYNMSDVKIHEYRCEDISYVEQKVFHKPKYESEPTTMS